jgi:hypothetical protein
MNIMHIKRDEIVYTKIKLENKIYYFEIIFKASSGVLKLDTPDRDTACEIAAKVGCTQDNWEKLHEDEGDD